MKKRDLILVHRTATSEMFVAENIKAAVDAGVQAWGMPKHPNQRHLIGEVMEGRRGINDLGTIKFGDAVVVFKSIAGYGL